MTHKSLSVLFFGLFLNLACIGCSSVNVLRLTSENFSPHSVDDVAILSQEPLTEHIRIADLSETSSSSVTTLQRHIVKKAAHLGADAVIFSVPVTRSEQRVDYQPVYSPWGSYSPYYYGPGPFGYSSPWGYFYGGSAWGYGQYVAVPYLVQTTTLRAIAIRYQDSSRERGN